MNTPTTWNVPVPFPGTDAEAAANRNTHSFHYSGSPEDADIRCWSCDSRPSHVAASYPCGADVPRQEITR